ncbi:hypothetical protein [Phyllobacterium sp. SB3]|uniref:hypothetical protein n=1 Tax=Phyllobacterium sp. SB3 TaxID=3156073 RepID=UPI0032AFA81F
MSTGALAIWHDIVPGKEEAVLDWYNREHHPERVGIAGFTRATRYRADNGMPSVFINYEVSSPDVLKSEAYLERVNNPTEWTRRCMPFFRNNSRTVCRVEFDSSKAIGGYAATLRFSAKKAHENSLRAALCNSILPSTARRSLIVRVQLWEALLDITAIPTTERELRAGQDTTTPSCIVVYASSQDALVPVIGSVSTASHFASGATDLNVDTFTLDYSLTYPVM